MSAPYLDDGDVVLHLGDCVEVMAGMDPESVDAICTDPPYGIRFMGKSWDHGDILHQRTTGGGTHGIGTGVHTDPTSGRERPKRHSLGNGAREAGTYDQSLTGNRAFQAWCETWATEALRVLRPGGHLLAFGGSRTFHRLTCAIEDAGFEIRDDLLDLHAPPVEAFMDSLDDGQRDAFLRLVSGSPMRAWLYGSGFPKSLDVSKAIDKANGAEREMVGEGDPFGRGSMRNRSRVEQGYRPTELNPDGGVASLTAPATPEAAAWQGWGTALKPAWEPIVVARKPLSGTVAANVLATGCGALNVGACRVGATVETWPSSRGPNTGRAMSGGVMADPDTGDAPAGRWPANVVLSHTPECREVGTRKVKGSRIDKPYDGDAALGYQGGVGGRPPRGVGDPDGTETVAAWECAPERTEERVYVTLDGLRLDLTGAPAETLAAFLRMAASSLRESPRSAGSAGWASGSDRALRAISLPDSPGGCPACRRSGDALLRRVEAADQSSPRPLADALESALDRACSPRRSPNHPESARQSSCGEARGDTPAENTPSSSTGSSRASASIETPTRTRRTGTSASPLAEFPSSTQESSTSGDAPGTSCDSGCTASLLRRLVAAVALPLSRHLPVAVAVETLYYAGCPVRRLDEEVGELVPSSAHVRHNRNQGHEGWGNGTIRSGDLYSGHGDTGGPSRFFYTAKASRAERDGATHPTVKPLALMRWLVRLVTPPGGVVLDPFAGSGTTGLACREEGFRCVLIERERDYCEMAAHRLRQLSLLGGIG